MSSYKVGSVCAIYGCNNYKQQKEVKSFYRMPKNIDILKKWIVACKRSDLVDRLQTKPPEYFFKTYVVCSDHFEIQCFRNKNLFSQGLFTGSIPTLKLYNVASTIKRKTREVHSRQPRQKETKMEMQRIVNRDTSMYEASDTHASTSTQHNEISCDLIAILKKEVSELKLAVKKYRRQIKNKASLLCKYKKQNILLKQKILSLKNQVKK